MKKLKRNTVSFDPGPIMRKALAIYLSDHHKTNKSELLREWIGQMLADKGYMVKKNGEWTIDREEEAEGKILFMSGCGGCQ